MRAFDWTGVDIAVPPRRLPGLRMAGFRQPVPAAVDITMVAHPAVTVLVDLSDGLGYEAFGRRGRGSVVVGLCPGELRAAGRIGECLQIRLEPALATAVLGTGLSGAIPLEAVLGRDAARWEDRLRGAPTWDARFALAASLLRARLGSRPVDAEVAYTWHRTLVGRGLTRVERLAEEVGWSRKRLWARFRAQLGITPKRAARLVRFDHAAHLLAAGQAPAEVAAVSGYVDQSHLHHEVRAFSGLTPAGVAVAPWLAIDDVAWPSVDGAASR
ncbi:helix-turn-helix domain-containing protein [Amycolatopsis rhabdoformis]|uniref:Helix-turn-helix domain-containing protein n=1 Tax=Amycolatopsis rhabdoformis TaxID=1448059 RepID=A0ABZ1I0H9_9PSEU|nr:helix-turn-helix domain-containing protein [Amycolatopsis rhabdoformis]WSE27302.1 helix-turn-helix domain-containing protein [Amycolatopsis rhabdoformis]